LAFPPALPLHYPCRRGRRTRDNGVTEEPIVESITYLAFYAGWPSAITAVMAAKEVFGKKPEKQ
jgi:alkylhydroperoxidase/carboxymuconolactone decarboxylase family protein YurZ